MGKLKDKELLRIAKKFARKIRKEEHIPGWHVSESTFPECEYSEIVEMLKEVIKTEEEK